MKETLENNIRYKRELWDNFKRKNIKPSRFLRKRKKFHEISLIKESSRFEESMYPNSRG